MITTDAIPLPPVPPAADLRDFDFTPIYRARLFGSAFHARATDAEWRAGVTLWLKCQDQTPAGSLPDDDVDLCRLAELGRDTKTWKKIKTGAMRGWYLASDGRLYNDVVAEVVNEQWLAKLKQRWATACAAIRKANQRNKTDDATPKFEEWLITAPASWKVPVAQFAALASHNPAPLVTRDIPVTSHVTDPDVTRKNAPIEETEKGQGRDRDSKKDDADERERIARKVLTSIEAWDDPNLRMHGGRISAWRDAGADMDLDIIPTLQTVLCKKRKEAGDPRWFPSSLNYFDKAIAEAVMRRTKPLPTGGTHDGTVQPSRRNSSQPSDLSDDDWRKAVAGVAAERLGGFGTSPGDRDGEDLG